MKVGDYVITKDRLHIGKIYNINNFREPSMMYAIDFPKADDFVFMGENDFKSSSNIIDLIEVGDYVNGYLVTMVSKDVYGEPIVFVGQRLIEENGFYRSYYNNQINYVLTKEQFESIQFKVKRIHETVKKECEKESAIKPSGYKGLIEKKE